MAEAIGIISGIVGLIEATVRVYDSIQKDARLPKTFKAVRNRLPVVADILRLCERNLKIREATIPKDVCRALENTLKACEEKILTVQDIFKRVLPGEQEKQITRSLESIKRLGKGKKIDRLLLGITEDVQVVVTHDGVMSASQRPTTELQEIIQEMKAFLTERDEERVTERDEEKVTERDEEKVTERDEEKSSPKFSSEGGAQYNNLANGFQINNSGTVTTQTFNTVIQKQREDFTFTEPIGDCFNEAPYMPDELFIGREDELQEMARRLKKEKRFVLTGTGGVGKTSLAIAYAKSPFADYTSILWLDARSQATLEASFRSIASYIWAFQDPQVLEESIIPERVRRWLSDRRNIGWLMIFDNYDEPKKFAINKYYPHNENGTIIITTRCQDAFAKSFNLKPLQSVSDCLKILQTRSEREEVESDLHAFLLSKRLAGLPLALATAGTFLRQSNFTFERYLQEYERRWNLDTLNSVRLEDYTGFGEDTQSEDHIMRTLNTAWNISYAELEKNSPAAAKVLKVLAFFGNQNLRYEYFHANININSRKWIRRLFEDEVVLEGIFRTLANYCFLEIQRSSRSWSMHNCVHDWVTEFQKEIPNMSYYWYAFDCLDEALRDVDENSFGHYAYSHLTAHAVRLVHPYFFDAAIDCGVIGKNDAWRLDGISRLLAQQSQVPAAEKIMAWALATYETFLGDEHELTLGIATNLARLYFVQKKYVKATEMDLRTLDLMENNDRIGPNHSSTLAIVYNLGFTYNLQGMLGKAEEMYSRALAGFTKSDMNEADRVSALRVISRLAHIYDEQGKLDEAERNFKQGEVGLAELLGPNHIFALDVTYDLGVLYRKRGKLTEAEHTFKRAQAGYEEIYGPDHVHTLLAVKALGYLYKHQGRLDEADNMFKRVLVGYEKL